MDAVDDTAQKTAWRVVVSYCQSYRSASQLLSLCTYGKNVSFHITLIDLYLRNWCHFYPLRLFLRNVSVLSEK